MQTDPEGHLANDPRDTGPASPSVRVLDETAAARLIELIRRRQSLMLMLMRVTDRLDRLSVETSFFDGRARIDFRPAPPPYDQVAPGPASRMLMRSIEVWLLAELDELEVELAGLGIRIDDDEALPADDETMVEARAES